MRKIIFIAFMFLISHPANAQDGRNWTLVNQQPVTVQLGENNGPTCGPAATVGCVVLEFQNTTDQTAFFDSSFFQGPFASDFIVGSFALSPQQPLCNFSQYPPNGICFLGVEYMPSTAPSESTTFVLASSQARLDVTINGLPPQHIYGKFAMFETNTSPNATGRCFDLPLPATCVYWFYNWVLTPNQIITGSPNPFESADLQEIDNASCGGTGVSVVNGNITNDDITLNLHEANGIFSFQGVPTISTITGWNFDGSAAPFSGLASGFTATLSGSSGACASDDGNSVQFWYYPSLNTSDLTLTFFSQPGNLNQSETIQMELQEDPETEEFAQFNVSATGTVVGPPAPCGPLTFNLNQGLALGPIYALNGTFTDAQGNQGQMSIGLFMVTPFTVSQQDLQNALYNASASGYPIQVWSFDFTATPACAADPAIGQGVAYLKHERPGHKRDKDRDGDKDRDRDKKKFWKDFSGEVQKRPSYGSIVAARKT